MKRTIVVLATSLLYAASVSVVSAQNGGPIVITANHSDATGPLRDKAPGSEHANDLQREKPLKLFKTTGQDKHAPDPVTQSSPGRSQPTAGAGFAGVGNGDYGFSVLYAPPDTNAAVGDTQIVQWVNVSFAVFDRNTHALLYGPAAGNTLWQGFGGGCETNNDGDIIVQFDKAAHRWVMTQFSVSTTPYLQCFAISQTNDATGTWYRYSLQMPNFPDYPKLGVWPDAYYMTFNMFSGNFFAGSMVCALSRTQMLTGAPASAQCFQLSAAYGGLLPSDLDGSAPPPAGSPDFMLAFGSNVLQLWKFHVDWNNSANTTLTGPSNLSVAAFNEACGGGTCIPQLGTSNQLDSLGDRLMYRLAYRNFGDHESLVVNHSVNTATSVGVRWYEVRSPNNTPVVYQQGTYAPDGNYRWMGSVAMDKAGNMALGYSLSGSGIYPAIAYTGRLAGDALGTMGAENLVLSGGGAQTSNLHRWGDYSSMAIDPNDDCTFWFTTEYLKGSGSFNWSTEISSFQFPGCSSPDFTISATPPSNSAVMNTNATYTVTVTPLNGYNTAVTLSASGPGGAASFNPPTLNSGTSTMTVPAGSNSGTFNITIQGFDGTTTHTTSVGLTVTGPPDFTISASPSSKSVVTNTNATYTVTVTPLNGYNKTVTLSASGYPAGTPSFNPPTLTSGTSTMTVPAGSSPSTSTITIQGSDGTTSHTTSVGLTVTLTPDFTIGVTPPSQTISRGQSTTYTVTIARVNGFNGVVNFSVTGLPSRSSASFSPSSVAGSGTTTMTVTTNRKSPTGTFSNVKVTATSGSLSHSQTVTLVLQ